jgi:hypothetical protein
MVCRTVRPSALGPRDDHEQQVTALPPSLRTMRTLLQRLLLLLLLLLLLSHVGPCSPSGSDPSRVRVALRGSRDHRGAHAGTAGGCGRDLGQLGPGPSGPDEVGP